MFTKLKSIFWVVSMLLCYPLYSLGQILLFISRRNDNEFYDSITRHPDNWINSHLILMAGIILMIPAYLAINSYFKNSKCVFLADLATFFVCISVFVLFGQYTIDLCTVDFFMLPKEKSYEVLDKIQNDSLIKSLFYDNSKIFFLLRFF